MQVAYVEEVLGVPPYRARDNSNREHLTWVEPDAYMHAVAADGTIFVFSVTTRHRLFAPRFYRDHAIDTAGHSIEIRLGRTRFGDLSWKPVGVAGSVGARRFGYSELYYFGNPGYYQTFAYSINDAGFLPESEWDLLGLIEKCGGVSIGQTGEGSGPDDEGTQAFLEDPGVERGRRQAVVNTLTVSAPMAPLDAGIGWLGADLDLVRALPDRGQGWWLRRGFRGIAEHLPRIKRGRVGEAGGSHRDRR